MSRFRGKGMRQQKMLTKGEMVDRYESRFNALTEAFQEMRIQMIRQLNQISVDIASMKKQMEAIDYRTVTTRELGIDKKLFTDDEHTEHARNLRIKDFDTQSVKDDVDKKLVAVKRASKMGDHITIQITANYPKTINSPSIKDKSSIEMKSAKGDKDVVTTIKKSPHPKADEKIDSLSFLRSKVQLGSGQLMPELEKEIVGSSVGETKVITMKMPSQYAEFAGQEVVFNVDVKDIKEGPPKEATPVALASTKEEGNGQKAKKEK